MADTQRIIDLLRESARKIESRGLAKGAWETPDGRVCLLGAMYLVLIGNPMPLSSMTDDAWALKRDAVQALRVQLSDANLMSWSDDPATTAQDAIDLFNRTADALEAQNVHG
jgi:hypothetical protein